MRTWRKGGLIFIVVVVLGVLVSGCTRPPSTTGTLRVTVTTGMIADLVRNIGGQTVTVEQLIPVAVDPHTYKATQADLRKIEQADLIIYNGLHLEGRMVEVFERIADTKPTVALGDQLDKTKRLRIEEEASPQGATLYDPHIWFDVHLWSQGIPVVRDALIAADPTHRTAYETQARAYEQQLNALHEEVRARIATLPDSQKVLVTAHDAFRYWGVAYGMEVHGLQGINTATEAGSRDVIALRDFLIARNVQAVFVESSVSQRALQAVIEGAKARGHDIRIGGALYSDALGASDSPAATYMGMIRHNVDTIVNGLKPATSQR